MCTVTQISVWKVGKIKMLTVVKLMIDRGFKIVFITLFTRIIMLMHLRHCCLFG